MNRQRIARLTGLLYWGTIIAGLYAEVAVRSKLAISGDAAATARNISAGTGLYRSGEAADLVMLCCYIAVTALFYRLFRPSDRTLSALAACFSLVGIAVLAAAGVMHMAPLTLMQEPGTFGLDEGARNAFIGLSLELHGTLYGISLVFFGFYCMLIGTLAFRSRLIPAPVSWIMIIGGLYHVTARFIAILSPETATLVPSILNLLPLLGEAAIASWLLMFGLREPKNIRV